MYFLLQLHLTAFGVWGLGIRLTASFHPLFATQHFAHIFAFM